MANRWAERECEDEECASFRERLRRHGVCARRWRTTATSSTSRARTRAARAIHRVVRRRAAALRGARARRISSRIPATSWTTREAGIARNADAITEALAARSGTHDPLPGDHGRLAAPRSARRSRSWPTIIALRRRRRCGDRVGVCVDTCHVYSAGYDLVRRLRRRRGRASTTPSASTGCGSCTSTTRRHRSARVATVTS